MWYEESLSQGSVVRRLISPNPGLNFNQGLCFFVLKAFSWIISRFFFRVPNQQIETKRIKLKLLYSFHIWIQILR